MVSSAEGTGSPFYNLLQSALWPYFADQFLNESYICDVWRAGLRMSADESGIITRNQIKSKVDELLGSKEFGTRVSILKEMARKSINKGGCFFENLSTFVDAMRE